MEFKENTSSQEQILQHLKACDPEFIRELSSRVDLEGYSQKLEEKSFRHEAWQGSELVGLFAVYHNHDPAGFDFVTNVSVSLNAEGQGIATELLCRTINKAKAGGSAELRLEVKDGNTVALRLYDKAGFTRQSEPKNNYVMLSLKLNH